MQIIALIATLLALAAAQECRNDFEKFVGCLKDQGMKKANDPENERRYRSDVDQCFSDQGCAPPNYDADPFADNDMAQALKEKLENLTPEQRRCLKNEIRGKIQDKIEDCLDEPIPEELKNAIDEKLDNLNFSDERKQKMKRRMHAKINIGKQVKICTQDGTVNAESLGKCLIDVKGKLEQAICQVRSDCSAQVSNQCAQRADGYRTKLCQCAEEAKNKAEDEIESSSGPGGFLRRMRNGRMGKIQDAMKQCGVDMSDLRDRMLAKCGGPLQCMRQMQQRGEEMRETMKNLKDYMEDQNGGGPLMCRCQ